MATIKSIEEKAKAYDEAIERARELHDKWIDEDGKDVALMIFPELAESEDEKTRKYLIKYITEYMPVKSFNTDAVDKQTILAWLEKQGEQILANSAKTCKIEQKPAWSEEDEEILNLIIARLHSHPSVEAEEYGKDYHWFKFLKDRVQPKPQQEWSEEDRQMRMKVLKYISTRCNVFEYEEVESWLNSIRPQKPIEWTMQDEEELQIALDTLVKAGQHSSAKWLKNVCLVPQNHWKPSEEQMKTLEYYAKLPNHSKVLLMLYNDLKKLTE